MANFNKKINCPMTATLHYIAGRWKCIILFFLTRNPRRFGEIAARIPAVSKKVLTQQLRELETDGLIQRREFKGTRSRVEYALTDFGKSLLPVLTAMAAWGKAHVLDPNESIAASAD